MTKPKQTTFIEAIPLPVLGRNTQDPINAVPPVFALEFENLIADQGGVSVRSGCVTHSTGIGSNAVETIAPFVSTAGVASLLACANGNIYNATNAGAATSLLSSQSKNRWITHQFNNRLFLVNGVDTPRRWNGAALEATGFTGPTSLNSLKHVTSFKDRLYFTEKNTGSIWFGGSAGITGALTSYPVESYLSQGGDVLFCTQWSQSTGQSAENQFVVIGENGDCLIFDGDSPETNWILARRLVIPPPLSARSFVRIGGDLVIATTSGIISLVAWVQGQETKGRVTTTDKINQEIKSFARRYSGNEGWDLVWFDSQQHLILNVPIIEGTAASAADSFQFVFNTETGSISNYTGWKCSCLAVSNSSLYFGANNGVLKKAYLSTTDDGIPIPYKLKTAFNNFQNSQNKIFKLLKLNLITKEKFNASFKLHTDFVSAPVDYSYERDFVGTFWLDPWFSAWGESDQIFTNYTVANGMGKYLSLEITGSVSRGGFSLSGIEIVGEFGGIN
jgi:hypothetical protein